MALKQGNLELAHELAEQGFEERMSQPDGLLHWEFRLLLSDVLLEYRKLEEVKSLLDPEAPSGSEFDEPRCRRALNLARIYLQRDKLDLEVAERLLQEAEELAVKLNSAPLLARIQLRKGYWHLRKAGSSSDEQRPALDRLAEEHFLQAIRKTEEAQDPYRAVISRGSLGFFLMSRLRFDEAVLQLKEALQAAQEVGDGKSVQRIAGNMGWCYYRLGNHEVALQLLRRAEREAAESGLRLERQVWLGNWGAVLFETGETERAVDAFKEASELARQIQNTRYESIWLSNLATAMIRKGDWNAARQFNQRALALKVTLPEAERNGSILYSQLNSAEIEIGQNRYRAAERILLSVLRTFSEDPTPHWEAQAALGGLYARMGRKPEAEEYFEAALQTFDAARAELNSQDPELIITFQERRTKYLQAYVEYLMQDGQPGRALWVVESSRAQVLAEGLGRKSAKPGGISQFQLAAQALGAVLLSYWIAPERSYMWTVTADGIRSHPLLGEEAIRKRVNAYGLILQRQDPLRDGNLIGSDLYRILLEPAQEYLKPGGRAVLVPSGILNSLNFETLIASDPEPHYWIEDMTLVLTPSLTFLQPSFASRSQQGSCLLMASSPNSNPLPNAEKELREIQKALEPWGLNCFSFSGAEAHSAAFEESAGKDHRLIHFATHAEANPESPLNSFVTLADRLYARTVASTKLAARLVTVSACKSAGAQSYGGEGLVGFAWAFLHAGANNVIAGLWNVNDDFSFKLMKIFYSNLSVGMHPAGALRQAKLTMLASEGPQSRPYYWAPFQIYTHSSPFESLHEPADHAGEPAETNGH